MKLDWERQKGPLGSACLEEGPGLSESTLGSAKAFPGSDLGGLRASLGPVEEHGAKPCSCQPVSSGFQTGQACPYLGTLGNVGVPYAVCSQICPAQPLGAFCGGGSSMSQTWLSCKAMSSVTKSSHTPFCTPSQR